MDAVAREPPWLVVRGGACPGREVRQPPVIEGADLGRKVIPVDGRFTKQGGHRGGHDPGDQCRLQVRPNRPAREAIAVPAAGVGVRRSDVHRPGVVDDPVVTERDAQRVVLFQGRDQGLEEVRLPLVIVMKRRHVLAVGTDQRGPGVHSHAEVGGISVVLDARIRKTRHHGPVDVLAARIVRDEDFHPRIRLSQRALQRGGEVTRPVEGGHDHADERRLVLRTLTRRGTSRHRPGRRHGQEGCRTRPRLSSRLQCRPRCRPSGIATCTVSVLDFRA
jgi:hypothetical protein